MKNQLPIKLIYKFCAGLLFLLFPALFYAQLEVEPTGVLFTPESLITNVFLGEGVQVTNITYEGDDLAVGYFSNGLNDVGIDRGIIMSSGFATTAATANSAGGTTGNTTGGNSDPDLGPIATGSLNDVARYEISFIPTADTLRFKYVFASEEYPEYACSGFNDVFGFFLTGPNPAGGNYVGENIALIPDLADPSGLTFTTLPVTINNVNAGVVGSNGNLANCTPPNGSLAFSAYYNDNAGSATLTYDAYLNVFIAQAVVTPCVEYTIKLAVADVGDAAFDTGVFLEAKSFGTGSLEVELATLSLDGTVTEDCASASVTFALPSIVSADHPIDYTIIGTATNGTDYDSIPLNLFIPQGDSSVTIPIIAHEDGLLEGVETIGIDVQRDPCNRDTFWLFIRDNELVPPDLGPDTTICKNVSVQLHGTLPITLPDPPTFTNNNQMDIVLIDENNPPPPGTLPTVSTIQVFGVQPVELQEGVIKRVCINIDHIWISDADVYLVAPNGQFLELTTDNGGSGDDYTETCFTPVATNPINFGSQAPSSAAPFTGDWMPEGDWEDLWTVQDPLTNGIWTLQVKDDAAGLDGTLLNWSICFNPLYQIDNYTWTPSAGLSCDDCPDPIATPDTTTTYYLSAMDTYGCEVYDSITITVLDILPEPDVLCSLITDNSIEFCWDDIPGSSGYEVNVNGNGWISSNGGLCHTVTGLSLEDTVTIEVYGLSNCNGEIATVVCWTPACTPPTASLDNVTDASCSDVSDGTAAVSAAGIYPPFEYSIIGVDTNTTGVFNSLPPGDYIVQIHDDVGCPQNVGFTVGAPDAIVTTEVLITNASCNGGADGSATVTVDGGTMPYSFAWNDLQTDSIASDLVVGDYFVTVTDLNGCSTIDTVAVTQPPVMSLTLETDSVSCNGAADGTATVTVVGGVGPYDYLWDDPTTQITATASNLSGGIYSVIVTDQNACTEIILAQIIENLAINLVIDGNDVNCNNGNDGTASVIASGGTNSYTYLWDDLNTQNTPDASGLNANDYNVIVTDSDGCVANAAITINEPDAIVLNFFDVPALCFGDANGQVSIISAGGIYPYTYSWSDTPSATDSVRTDLIAGDYAISVTDANGCEETIDVTVFEPAELALALSISNVACNGDNDGTMTAGISGGTPPFSFLWDANANNQDTQTAVNLSAGSYTVTVTDFNGCTVSGTGAVTQPTAIQLSITNEDIACFGNNTGSADLLINGGTLPIQSISWLGPNSFSSNLEDITDLYAGTYNVVVTDANGCIATDVVVIDQPATGIMSSMSQPDTICNAAATGVANVTVNGGTGPYTYNWSNGSSSPLNTNLSDGTYFVTITDNGNCTFVDTAFIVETEIISISLSQVGALCHDGNEGSATIDAIFLGGANDPLSNYTYLWSSSGQNTVTASNLTGGQTYTVTVTDFRGCTATASIPIDNPAEIGSNINEITNVSCFEGGDGTATAVGEGGTAPYSFLWDANTGNQAIATVIDLPAGNYAVTVTDANGCSTVDFVDIAEPALLEVDFNTDDVDCYGDENGSIQPIITGGTPGFTYSWSNNSSSNSIDLLEAGIYSLTITDNNGCTAINETEVFEPDQLSATVEIEDVACFGGRDGSLTFIPFGGTPPYTYSLDGEVYSGSDLQVGLIAGEYSAYIQDARGCTAYVGQYFIAEPDLLSVDLGENILIQYGETVQLNPTVTNGLGTIIYSYDPEDSLTLSCLNCPDPFARPLYTTNYELIIVDENGCTAEDMIMIVVEKDRNAYVPSGFSPNNDNINDRLVVHGKDIEKVLVFRIFDRWGELVYEISGIDANDETSGWDGTFNGLPMNPAVFVWYTEVEFIDGSVEVFKGNTTLLR